MFLRILKYLFLFSIYSISIIAQIDSDSLTISLDKLLEKKIDGLNFVESASKYSQSLEEAPSYVSVITNKQIENYGYQTISELLNSQVGFYISNDRNYDYIGVRGFSRPTDYNNRILLLIDGHRLNEYIYDGGLFGRNLGLDINNFERVEIIRGPGSALYGTSAMLAVINLVPKRVTKFLTPRIKLSYDSFGTKTISLNAGHTFENKINLSVNTSYTESDGEDIYFAEFDAPETNNGHAIGVDNGRHYGMMASFNYKNFKLQGYSSYSLKNVPTAPWESDFNHSLNGTEELNFIEANFFHNLSYNSQISVRAFFDNYYFFSDYPYEGELTYDKNNGETVGSEIQLIWDILPNNRITTGLEYKNILRADYKYWDDYDIYNEFDVPYEIFSMYLQDEFQLNNKFSCYFGLRYDNYLEFENSLSPRLGIIYHPWEAHTFKFLYGNAFRAPNAYERKYEDPIYGFKVNPNGLSPETATTAELIWQYNINDIFTSISSVYYYGIKDLIDQIEDPEDDFYLFENFGKTSATGIDLSLEAKFNYSFGAYLRYSYQNTEDQNSNKLTNSPSHLLKFGIYKKVLSPVNIALEYKYGSKRLTVYGTETKPIHLAKVNIFTDPIVYGLKFSLTINNLFNNTIKYPGGWEHVQPAIIQPGRNYNFSIFHSL